MKQVVRRIDVITVIEALIGAVCLVTGLVLTFSAGIALIVFGVLVLGAVAWGSR